MKRLTQLIPLIAAAGMLIIGSGCQSTPNYKQGHDFGRYKSFAILPLPTTGTYEDPAMVTRLSRPAKEAVVDTLTSKGLKQVSESEADMHVKMLFDFLPEQGRMESRMFALQMLDGKTKEVVWSDYWHRSTDTTLPPESVRKGIADMVSKFPPTN